MFVFCVLYENLPVFLIAFCYFVKSFHQLFYSFRSIICLHLRFYIYININLQLNYSYYMIHLFIYLLLFEHYCKPIVITTGDKLCLILITFLKLLLRLLFLLLSTCSYKKSNLFSLLVVHTYLLKTSFKKRRKTYSVLSRITQYRELDFVYYVFVFFWSFL